MKTPPRACVVLSDYPIKTMAYQRFLDGLCESEVYFFRNIDDDFSSLSQAKLVVCDMNIMEAFEKSALTRLEQAFPVANILFLEEDHSDMQIKFSNQRDICRLGKLAEINVIHLTLKELLLQSDQKNRKTPRGKKERLVQT